MEKDALQRWNLWTEIYKKTKMGLMLVSSDPDGTGFSAFIQAVHNYLVRLLKAMAENEPIVWFNLGWNNEFLHAFDVTGVCVQQLGVFENILQNNEMTTNLIDLAEATGYRAICAVRTR